MKKVNAKGPETLSDLPNARRLPPTLFKEYESINPANGEILQTFKDTTDQELEAALKAAAACLESWRGGTFAERTAVANKAAEILGSRLNEFARPVTLEMGKRFEEAQAEVRSGRRSSLIMPSTPKVFWRPEKLHPEWAFRSL